MTRQTLKKKKKKILFELFINVKDHFKAKVTVKDNKEHLFLCSTAKQTACFVTCDTCHQQQNCHFFAHFPFVFEVEVKKY